MCQGDENLGWAELQRLYPSGWGSSSLQSLPSSENPPPWISALHKAAQLRPHTHQVHRLAFLFCLPHPRPALSHLSLSEKETVWVPCRVSAPTFSPLSEMCKQQRQLLGERHGCSHHRSDPASHPGPRQAARAGDTQHLSWGEGDESLENRPRHRARAGRRWSCEASIFGSGGIGVIRAARSSLPTQK